MVNALTNVGVRLSLIAFVAMILTGAACLGQTPAPATPTPVPDPATLLAETAENLRTVQSARFQLTHEAGSVYLPAFGAKITEISGTWDAAAGAELSIDAYLVNGPEIEPLSGSYVQLRAYVTPVGYFATEPISGVWLKQPARSSPVEVTRLQHIVADLVAQVENPVLVGEEATEGVATYRISGIVPASSMEWLPVTASAGQSLQIEVWTDTDRKLLRRITTVGAVGEFDAPDTSRTIRFSGIGEAVTITPPEQFIDLSGG